MAEHNDLGNIGEKKAKTFLLQKGYQIQATNWRTGNLELDIIAKKDDKLIIIEVKTRSTSTFEHPREAITLSKIKRLVTATQKYIEQCDWQGDTRFDVISVIPNGQSFEIEHIEDAFLPPIS